ncbi:MAG TPA: peptide ABC transporter substrate-binding protein, partial [Thermomicrobiaceae bacterium]|nr:peptide ABC transporter substrate-binding protein [Thermomicrobiaceae bacterium]
MESPELKRLYAQAVGGKLTRRQVLRRAAALGLSAPAIAMLLAACGGSSSNNSTATTSSAATTAPTTAATSATGGGTTPAATAAATSSTGSGAATPAGSPTASAANVKILTSSGSRGDQGELKLLWWQAPTILNSHLAQGTKDYDASRPVSEGLADFDSDGNFIPLLAAEIPSLDNGGVSSDGKTVTWKLKQGVKWSDGQPFTSKDVKFTYDYVTDPATASVSAAYYAGIDSIDTPDDNTVVIHFKDPTPAWYGGIFCGDYGRILPEHVLSQYKGAQAHSAPYNLKPIGTGPYKVDDFKPGDVVSYSINDNFREANQPHFKTVTLKGGGDATSAARAAIQTGEADFAWNLQVDWSVLSSLQSDNGPGKLLVNPGNGVERILINLTDPNKEVNGERSHLGTPHPFQSDLNVRKAYALLVDRDTMAKQLYGQTGVATANLLTAPAKFVSKNTSFKFDPDGAGTMLDTAGWKKGGSGVREKDGVQMKIVYQTSVNALRQKEQEIVKQAFDAAGIQVQLKSIDAGVYFSSDAGNNDTANHFYADIEMYTNSGSSPYPIDYMSSWWGDPSNIAQKSNQWAGLNVERWQNADYDAA